MNRRAPGLATTLLATGLAVACGSGEQDSSGADRRLDYANVLNLHNTPVGARDEDAACFFDLGAWHGYALPPDTTGSVWGVFPGPFLLDPWRWLSTGLTRLEIANLSTGERVDLRHNATARAEYLPGELRQSVSLDGLTVRLELAFVDAHWALIRARVTNDGTSVRELSLSWTGELFTDASVTSGPAVAADSSGILVPLQVGNEVYAVRAPPGSIDRITVDTDRRSYRIELKAQPLAAGSTRSTALILGLENDTSPGPSAVAEASLHDPDAALRRGEERWNEYLGQVLDVESPWLTDVANRRVAVKCLQTLLSNWKAPRGALRHAGLIPSYNIHYFNGFWAWDSWKHAAALSRVAPELARDQLRAMLAAQDSTGMIADCVFADPAEDNWRDTKPPLAAWAVWSLFEATNDLEVLREFYPALDRYHRWWYRHRDHDGNGLCEYGSTDGTLVAARWESGMDNAARFDASSMVQNGPAAWSMTQESVDLNAYLYREKIHLADMATELSDPDRAAALRAEAKSLQNLIQTRMFDEEDGYFYDIDLATRAPIRVAGPEGWIPLWAGVATPQQAERVAQVMGDSTTFATHVPFPTLSRSHPEFSRGYWRGPVWLDQAYFAVRALQRYGFTAEAADFTRRLLDHPQGLKNADSAIRENYDALTGEGLSVRHFSWSAAHILMLLTGW